MHVVSKRLMVPSFEMSQIFLAVAPVLLMASLSACTGDSGLDTGASRQEKAIDAMMVDYAGPVPGASVLVAQNGTILYRKAFGQSELEPAVPATTATNYRLASVTKQFTATTIMLLVERGMLTYDSRLPDIFEGFPEYGESISISNLLSHTSGIVDYEDLISDSATVQVRDADILRVMRDQAGTYFEPGTQFRYSNTGYALLAMIVEQVSGESFARFLEENIFYPVGMEGTVAYEAGVSTVTNRAYGYARVDAGDAVSFTPRDQSSTSAVLGDGGIYSSIDDLYKWDQVLSTGVLLSVEAFENAWTAKPATLHGEGEAYGYGWYVDSYGGHRNLRHSGSTSGFRNDIERFPDCGLTVIVLTNRDEPDVKLLARRIADVYLGGIECDEVQT